MEPTGIVRRIDELGRVVIPKEIRRALVIREGDPLELFTNSKEETVIIRKYHPEKIFSFDDDELREIVVALNERIREINSNIEFFKSREEVVSNCIHQKLICETIIDRIDKVMEEEV